MRLFCGTLYLMSVAASITPATVKLHAATASFCTMRLPGAGFRPDLLKTVFLHWFSSDGCLVLWICDKLVNLWAGLQHRDFPRGVMYDGNVTGLYVCVCAVYNRVMCTSLNHTQPVSPSRIQLVGHMQNASCWLSTTENALLTERYTDTSWLSLILLAMMSSFCVTFGFHRNAELLLPMLLWHREHEYPQQQQSHFTSWCANWELGWKFRHACRAW